MIGIRQAHYAAYDSEVLVRSLLITIMLEMRLRGFAELGEGGREWAVDCELDCKLVQKARDTEDGKVKKMESVWWWGWVLL